MGERRGRVIRNMYKGLTDKDNSCGGGWKVGGRGGECGGE